MALLVVLPEISLVENQEFSLVDIIPPWIFMLIYHLGTNSGFFGGRSSVT
jgi:hypothetical protein